MIAPLRAVEIKSLLAALKRRWRIFAVTSLLVLTLILLGSVLFVIPQFALPILIGKAAVSTGITLQLTDDYSPKQFGFIFSMSGGSIFFQLLKFVTPVTAIMASLLYIKTRKAELSH